MADQERQEIDRREKLVIGLEAWVCFGPLVMDQPIGNVVSLRRETGGRSIGSSN